MPISWAQGKSAKTQGPAAVPSSGPEVYHESSVWTTLVWKVSSWLLSVEGSDLRGCASPHWESWDGSVAVPTHQSPNLGHPKGAVPGHRKSEYAAKWVLWMFWLLSGCKSYVDTISGTIMCIMALYLKKLYTDLTKKYCIAKECNRHLSLQRVTILVW